VLKALYEDSEDRMKKRAEVFDGELSKLRTGRAHPSLLAEISVIYYGNATPLKQVASIGIEDARTLSVTPWDKTALQAIDKAIRTSDLGLNPMVTGTTIHVPLPPLTEERRKELVKRLRGLLEEAKVAIRNIRRDSKAQIKELLKAKQIAEDDERRAEEVLQKITDRLIADLEKRSQVKETELMQI